MMHVASDSHHKVLPTITTQHSTVHRYIPRHLSSGDDRRGRLSWVCAADILMLLCCTRVRVHNTLTSRQVEGNISDKGWTVKPELLIVHMLGYFGHHPQQLKR